MGGSNYSQTQLLAIQKELNKKIEESGYENIKRNVTGYGVGLRPYRNPSDCEYSRKTKRIPGEDYGLACFSI